MGVGEASSRQVVIRVADDGDADAIARLLGELGYPAPVDDIPRRLARVRRDENSQAFVAVRDGGVIGLATALTEPSLTNPADIGLVTALVVSEAHRGSGAGRALLHEIETWGRAHGCRKFVVTTANHRQGAHAFYDRLGWEWTGRRYVRFPPEDRR